VFVSHIRSSDQRPGDRIFCDDHEDISAHLRRYHSREKVKPSPDPTNEVKAEQVHNPLSPLLDIVSRLRLEKKNSQEVAQITLM